ncbi:hypothetical protein BGW36DRAFT_423095 [Talaromyces proteolyticus]|uniref:Small secreted protein n=1 Tax=Talaromyces proteolyticus TaxID=1131652 RepID=A0AAD4KYW6_9EURO|nr:uncharacterized protein BGW36DRAFT_423095 [Talaromyces proteolyticus]KAH8703537.1 hypothetical protein BGW36DRAFT_423095 [Talaromyces proteolyticus]
MPGLAAFQAYLSCLACVTAAQYTPPSSYNVTTLTASNNASVLQCWSIQPGFSTSSQPGISGSAVVSIGTLNSTTNATLSVLPGNFNGGQHHAPAAQWVFFLSGVAHITLPHSSDEAYIVGGKHGGILALDTADVSVDGHFTVYPTNEVTTSLELQLENGIAPPHVSLHDGPCTAEEQNY